MKWENKMNLGNVGVKGDERENEVEEEEDMVIGVGKRFKELKKG